MERVIAVFLSVVMMVGLLPICANSKEGTDADRLLFGKPISTATGKMCVDFPDSVNGNKFTGSILVQGWAIDKNDVSKVLVQIDSRPAMEAELYHREDVAAAYPNYPVGKEGFTLSLPAKDFPAGTHTAHFSYTSGNGTSYTITSETFTVLDTPEYTDCYKYNGHSYYLFDNHYTRAEAESFATENEVALADVSGIKAKEAVLSLAKGGGSFHYWIGGNRVLNAKTGVVTTATSDYIEEKCGFIIEAVDRAPSFVVKAQNAVYAIFDHPLLASDAESLRKKISGTWATASEAKAFSAYLSDAEQAYFRLESGYIAKDGTTYTSTADGAMGMVMKYTKSSLPSASVAHNGSTFYAVDDRMPWIVAEAMAELLGGRLAVIPDTETQDKIATIVTGNTRFSYWVGGNDLNQEGVFEWIDGSTASAALRYQSGEPNNYNYNEDYLMVYRDYNCTLNDNGSEDLDGMDTGFLVEIKDTDVLEPTEALWFQNHAYVRYNGAFARIAAEQAASSVGGKLLSIDSDAERLALSDFVKNSPMQGYHTNDKNIAFSTYAANLYQVTHASAAIGLIVEFDTPVTVAAQATVGGTRFVAYDAAMPFEAAKAYAEAMGGTLALPQNASENAAMASMLAGKAGKYFIGAQKTNGGFVSADGTTLSYTAWGTDANGTYACTNQTGAWQAVLCTNPEAIGFIAAYTQDGGTLKMDSLFAQDGKSVVSIAAAQHTTGNATLLYCMYDEANRFIGVASQKLTAKENVPQYETKELTADAAFVRVLLWDNKKDLHPMAIAEEKKAVASLEAMLPQGNTDFAAFAKEGIYYLRNRETKTYLSLSELGIKADTKAVLADEAHHLFSAFRIKNQTAQTASISPLCANNGEGARLTILAGGADYSSADSTYFLVQNTDGTFCIMDEDQSYAVSSDLRYALYSGADSQKWELVPLKALSEKNGSVRNEDMLYSGAGLDFVQVKNVAAGASVTIYGSSVKAEDGAEWCYVSDGTAYGFIKKDNVKISGDSIYTYAEALAKKGAAGDGQGVLGYGVDVSKWDADVNYNTLKANGYSYVIIRIGTNYNGSYNKDAYFEQNYTNARAAGMDVGVYFYTYSTSIAGSQRDSDQVAAWLNGRELTYPVYYDLEDATISAACSYSTITEMARTFLSRMENTHGYYSGVYANLNWMNNMFDSKDIGKNYDLWVARYTYSVNVDYSSTFGMWQYSGDHEYIAGMPNTQADLNVVYKNYPEIIRALGMSYTGN